MVLSRFLASNAILWGVNCPTFLEPLNTDFSMFSAVKAVTGTVI